MCAPGVASRSSSKMSALFQVLAWRSSNHRPKPPHAGCSRHLQSWTVTACHLQSWRQWLFVICNHGDSDYSSSAIMATVTIRLLQSWRQWLFVICNHEQCLLVICNHGVTVHQRNYNWPILLLSVQCVTCDFISRFVVENAFFKINVLPETLFFHTIERVSNTKSCCYQCVVNILQGTNRAGTWNTMVTIKQELEHHGNNQAGTWTPG